MPRDRTFTLGAATTLIAAHLVILVVWHGKPVASLLGDWIGFGAAALAAMACWSASGRSGAFGRRVWRLASLSLALAALGQLGYTYFFDYRHAPQGSVWLSDILVFFWAVPATMTLFLSPQDPKTGLRWLRAFDFAQVCSLVLALELSVLYLPSRWQMSGTTMEFRVLVAGIIFFGALALAFLVRGLLTRWVAARAFFLRMGAFFFAFGITTNTTLFGYVGKQYSEGTWFDLPWTLVYGLIIGMAAAWDKKEPPEPIPIETPTRHLQMLAQFSPLLIPPVVFALVLPIAQEQLLWATVLAIVSFAAASGHLFVVQNQLLQNSRELQKNFSLLRGITEGTTDAVFVKDLHGRYLMINTAGARLLGLSVDEVLGKNDRDLFSPETAVPIMARDRAVLQLGESQVYEEVGGSGGVTRTYLATKSPYRDAGGDVVGLIGISRDITERKRAEEEIRRSQQKLRLHVDLTPLAVIEWDNNFCVRAWNPSAERIFGYSTSEALGRHASLFVAPQFRDHVEQVGKALLQRQGGTRSSNDNLTKDGRTISCEWYNTPLVDDAGNVLGVASLVLDVTERVALEERLRQSHKMEAIGQLAGGVAHDFNNLLTIIMGYVDLLSDNLASGSRLSDATAQIRSAADRAAGITRQLLAFGRKQVLTPRVINLNDIVLNLDTMLRRLIGEDIEVATILAPDLGSAKADSGQIEQIIMNLALNARDAMPQGGRLVLETGNVELNNLYAQNHRPVEPGRYVMLAVSDTGHGMDPATQARIFEPFFTTKEVGKGTGLGLSTVYGIVKQSGAFIWVYSEPEKGTTFKIYFPRVDQPAEPYYREKRVTTLQHGHETILVVEDDPQLRDLTSMALQKAGYVVLHAADPAQGLAVCRTSSEIHLLITDVVMPGMNGRKLADEVVKLFPTAKVLFVSGYTSNAIANYGVLESGLWFLPKPFSLANLVAKVREVLDTSAS